MYLKLLNLKGFLFHFIVIYILQQNYNFIKLQHYATRNATRFLQKGMLITAHFLLHLSYPLSSSLPMLHDSPLHNHNQTSCTPLK